MGASGVRVWYISYTEDQFGNRINYAYDENTSTGEVVPSEVTWTSNTGQGLTPRYRIDFVYEPRPSDDQRSGYDSGGARWATTQRIDRIDVAYNGTQAIGTYDLSYTMASVTGRSQLEKVSFCRGSPCLGETVFAVQDGTSGWGSLSSSGLSTGGDVRVGDFDNDGKQDLFISLSNTWQVYRGTDMGGLESALNSGVSSATNPDAAQVLDYNGDGRADLLFQLGTTWYVLRTNPTGTGFETPLSTGVSTTAVDNAQIRDYDGDGLGDWLYIDGQNLMWRRNLGTSSFAGPQTLYTSAAPTQSWAPTFYSKSFVPLSGGQDYNGDGRADYLDGVYTQICPFPPDNCFDNYSFGFYVAAGASSYASYFGFSSDENIWNLRNIDINGDGLDDIAYRRDSTSTWYTRLSTGTGFTAETDTTIPVADAFLSFVADFDNDGREDLIRPDGNVWRVHRSNGTSLSSSYIASVASTGASSTGGFATDLSGDGFPEIVRSNGGFWATHTHASDLPDVVTSFTDGLGYSIGVTYESLSNTDSDHYTLGGTAPPAPYIQRFSGARYVVTHEDHDDGIGGTRPFEHRYDTAFVDVSGRGWYSFAWHLVHDAGRGLDNVQWFNQTWPFVGRTDRAELRRAADDQVIREVDPVLSQTPWTSTTPDRHFVRVEETTTKEYEVGGTYNGTHLRNIVDDPEYDTNYGHLTSRTTRTEDPLSGEVWTSETLLNSGADTDAGDWCLGQPGLVQTTNTRPDSTAAVRKVRYVWNADNCALDQMTDESEDSNAKRLRMTHYFDGYGNPDIVIRDSADGAADDRSLDFTYDDDGQYPTSVTIGTVNLTTSAEWDYLTGQRASVTGPDGLTTSWTYDAFGRLAGEIRPAGSTAFTFTDCSSCWPQGAEFYRRAQGSDGSESYEYFDAFERSVGSSWVLPGSAEGRQETRYDALGQVEQTSRPYIAGQPVYWVCYAYDLLGRQTQENAEVSGCLATGRVTSYDHLGHELRIEDPKTQATRYVHNAAGQIKQVIDALNGTTAYTYHPFGELASVTDDALNTTTIAYDARGYKSGMSDPDLGSWSYDYGVFGELDEQTDAKSQTVELIYDAAGRPISRFEPEGATYWTYHTSGTGRIGKLDTVTSTDFSATYDYSPSHGATTLARRVIYAETYDTNFSYDSEGRLDILTYPESTSGFRFQVNYDYGASGHLWRVKNHATPSLVYYELSATDALGREATATLGNGLTETRNYDPATGILESIQTGPSASVQDLFYVWDEALNIEQRTDYVTGKVEDFTFDALDRLKTVEINSGLALSIDYNSIGNIQYKSDVGTYSYGADGAGPHAVTGISGVHTNEYGYDANGNMSYRDGDTVKWYSFNKPKNIDYGINSVHLCYDADRQLMEQAFSSAGSPVATLRYVGQYFEEHTSGSTVSYLHHIFVNGRAVARFTNDNSQAADTRYLHRDNLNSVVATTDDTGAVQSRYEFDVFGTRSQTYGGGVYTQKGFTGHEHLDAVDLIDMKGRVQDPLIGRFISADPFVQAPYHSQSLNRYSYAWNNPSTNTDPSGFTVCEDYHNPVCEEVTGFGTPPPGTPGTGGVLIDGGLLGYAGGEGGGLGGGLGGSGGGSGAAAGPLEEVVLTYQPGDLKRTEVGREWNWATGRALWAFSFFYQPYVPYDHVAQRREAGERWTRGLSGLNELDTLLDPNASIFARGVAILTFTPVGKGPAFLRKLVPIGTKVDEIHGTLDPIAQGKRTTAVLRTDAGDIAAGGARDLTPAQRQVAESLNATPARAPGAHAEVTAIEHAQSTGARMRAIETSRDICPNCQQAIEAAGGTLTGPRSATFP